MFAAVPGDAIVAKPGAALAKTDFRIFLTR
jgi:hypothetical protein